MYSAILLLTIISLPVVQSQMWPGVFRTAPVCAQAFCCCPTSDIYVTETPNNKISLNLTLAGVLCMDMSSLYQDNLYKPIGFSMIIPISLITFTISLTNDSNTITVASTLGPQCTAVANRIGTISQAVDSTTLATDNSYDNVTTPGSNGTRQYIAPSLLFYFLFACLVLNNQTK